MKFWLLGHTGGGREFEPADHSQMVQKKITYTSINVCVCARVFAHINVWEEKRGETNVAGRLGKGM